ncbi:LysR family transcriptional regulator [Amycolatopsis nigrescens]|uniref:LysR family transcriptional regulator n=1 Tax=Amycolatopsis nigrescens TaxID=381445 RepID=UPI00036992BF|nr:LysR family transcriptional regulator [Amycolatopsis nigrescens]
MELRRLRYFTAVFAEGSLSRAAEQLRISQPALTRQIRQLEHELGVAVFERVPTGVRPTPAGAALNEHAQLVLRLADASREVARSAGPAREIVRIGLAPGVPTGWLHRVLGAVRERAPHADIAFTDASSTDQLRMIREGRLDLGLAHQQPPSVLAGAGLFEQPFGLAVRPGHALAGTAECRLSDLDGLRVLAHARDQVPTEHDRLLAAAHHLGVSPVWVFARFTENALACAEAAGTAAVLLTESSAGRLLPGWPWSRLVEPPFLMRTWLVRQPVTRAIVERVATVVAGVPVD